VFLSDIKEKVKLCMKEIKRERETSAIKKREKERERDRERERKRERERQSVVDFTLWPSILRRVAQKCPFTVIFFSTLLF
jgi:hypothetical protein